MACTMEGRRLRLQNSSSRKRRFSAASERFAEKTDSTPPGLKPLPKRKPERRGKGCPTQKRVFQQTVKPRLISDGGRRGLKPRPFKAFRIFGWREGGPGGGKLGR